PKEFTPELVKEMLNAHRKNRSSTRICIKRMDYGRYERLVNGFRRKKFDDAAGGGAMAHEVAFRLYNELSSASQSIARGMVDRECCIRISAAASSYIGNMCSTKEAVRFLVEIVGKEPALYDHGAITGLMGGSIAWNVLKLQKGESKLIVQSALLHDAERHCAYIGHPADPTQISVNVIREISSQTQAKIAFNHANIVVLEQFRERFDGEGFPNKKKGAEENDPLLGINRMARVVTVGCAFSEYMLKRRNRMPLNLASIQKFMRERATAGELDPAIVDGLFDDFNSGKVHRVTDQNACDDDGDGE
ncbi:MAG: hypothetical protein NTV34_03430, partial [Proteobacteria bacterium]|nr:hypothetical protein [Pseudomonadota bacterium]